MTRGELKDLQIALQRAKKEFESGRSMVEMLGVLAVIGVLSVAGIAGFKTAMVKHRSNELMNEASKRAVIAMAQIAQGRPVNQISFAEFTDHEVGGATFVDTQAIPVPDSNNKYGIEIRNVEKAVCQNLVNMAGGRVQMAKAATPGTPMSASDCSDNKEQNSLAFVYDLDNVSDSTSAACTGAAGTCNGDTSDKCTGSRPGPCAICRKTFVDSTETGEWYDDDGKCQSTEFCTNGQCESYPCGRNEALSRYGTCQPCFNIAGWEAGSERDCVRCGGNFEDDGGYGYCGISIFCQHGSPKIGGGCTCDSGYTGTHCSNIEGAVECIYGSPDGYGGCDCWGGYTGTYCDQVINSGGYCVHGWDNGYGGCDCWGGYTGPYCDQLGLGD